MFFTRLILNKTKPGVFCTTWECCSKLPVKSLCTLSTSCGHNDTKNS